MGPVPRPGCTLFEVFSPTNQLPSRDFRQGELQHCRKELAWFAGAPRASAPGHFGPTLAWGYPRGWSLDDHDLTGHPALGGLSGHPCPSGQSLRRRSASFTGRVPLAHRRAERLSRGRMDREVHSRPPRTGRHVRPTPEDSRAARAARRAGGPGNRGRERWRVPRSWMPRTKAGTFAQAEKMRRTMS